MKELIPTISLFSDFTYRLPPGLEREIFEYLVPRDLDYLYVNQMADMFDELEYVCETEVESVVVYRRLGYYIVCVNGSSAPEEFFKCVEGVGPNEIQSYVWYRMQEWMREMGSS